MRSTPTRRADLSPSSNRGYSSNTTTRLTAPLTRTFPLTSTGLVIVSELRGSHDPALLLMRGGTDTWGDRFGLNNVPVGWARLSGGSLSSRLHRTLSTCALPLEQDFHHRA